MDLVLCKADRARVDSRAPACSCTNVHAYNYYPGSYTQTRAFAHTQKKMHVLRPLEAKSPIQAGARSDRKNGSPGIIPGDNNIMFLIGNDYLKIS